MEISVGFSNILPKVLLMCGIFASFLKVGTDVLACRRWKEYSFVSRSISELSAIGAPTRPLVLSLDLVYALLMIAFSIGIWQMAGQNLLVRIVAILIAGNAMISAFVSLFLPMRINPEAGSSASTIHVVLMATGVFFFLFAMGIGGFAYHNWFRYYSFGTLLIYLVLTIARFLVPSPTSAGLPVPTVGIQEHTMALGYLLWVAALAIQHLPSIHP